MNATTVQMMGAALFGVALIHTFLSAYFERLAHRQPAHAGLWHLLGEVEVVFGVWAMVLVVGIALLQGQSAAVEYVDSRNYTEPLFVFAVMVIAASRPITTLAASAVDALARVLPVRQGVALYGVLLSSVPLLGSLITEPAAMTLAALLLRDRFFIHGLSDRLKYATVGVLFVNISIGGTLTHFAAPPVLMVAAKWGFDTPLMMATFGWKSAVAVLLNAGIATALFARELSSVPPSRPSAVKGVPAWVIGIHLICLMGVVIYAHHPAIFLGLFLFFLGYAQAYDQYQDRLIIRQALLVAFFLAGLIVLGGMQQWWLQDILTQLSPTVLFFGAAALTAITDNAALTYLGSLVEGVSDAFKYALVAGAVTGGGLTVIANAPNPAGMSILKSYFKDESIHPLYLFVAALAPTLTAIAAFQCL